MSNIRTIEYPGVEIKEKVVGAYPTSAVGTMSLICGYTHKGQLFNPTALRSEQSFLDNFGAPTNDAEAYTYEAVLRLLTARAVPVVARMPYANQTATRYRGVGLTFAAPAAFPTGDLHDQVKAELGVTKTAALTTSSIIMTNDRYAMVEEFGDFTTPIESDPDDVSDVSGCNFVAMDYRKSIADDLADHAGLFLVIFDPVQSLIAQRFVTNPDSTNSNFQYMLTALTAVKGSLSGTSERTLNNWAIPLSGDITVDSVSRQVLATFPSFVQTFSGNDTVIASDYNNYIGVAVCRVTTSDSVVNHDVVNILETYIGSVVPARDLSSGRSTYIVDIINAASMYVRLYANRLNQSDANDTDTSKKPMPVDPTTTVVWRMDTTSKITSFPYGADAKKIRGNDVTSNLAKILSRLKDVDAVQIDSVVEAGLGTIAQFTSQVGDTSFETYYDPDQDNTQGVIQSSTAISAWIAVANSLEQFCSGTRRDCVALLDAPRNATLIGSQKIVRPNNPDVTFANTLITGFMLTSAAQNSSYSALYANWAKMYTAATAKSTWFPPSCFAAAACGVADVNFAPWYAPAFFDCGLISGIDDVSLDIDADTASFLYPKSLNYIKYFPANGYVIWGQKTTQKIVNPVDRLNVRRSVVRQERYVYENSRQFIGRPNNLYTRRNWIAVMDPYFRSIKAAGGIYNYYLLCDETNNTPEVIDSNILRGAVAIQPVKAGEFVIATMIIAPTGMDLAEAIQQSI